MEVLDLLYEEHKVIKRAANVIEVASFQVTKGKDAVDLMLEAAHFLLRFSVRCHQRKEEELFFAIFHNRGILPDILEAMQVDNRAGKDFLRDLSGTLIRYDGNRISLLPALLWKSSGYLWFLRHHIKIEEDIFFSMARTFFSTKEEEMLAKQFARWELERQDQRLHMDSDTIIGGWEEELRA